MKKVLLTLLITFLIFIKPNNSFASHGLPLVGFGFTVGATGVTIFGSSDPATCGGGPYWMQVELGCTAGAITGVPSPTMQAALAAWPCTGGGSTYNSWPWYNSTQTIANLCSDGCVLEAYNNIFIPFSSLCPGQTYFFAAREWVNTGVIGVGPWTAVNSFVVPGVLVPLTASIAASPSIYCSPGSSVLSITGITGGCGGPGGSTVLWSTGATGTTTTVSPGIGTTVYTATVTSQCNTVVKSVTVTVLGVVSAAFTPLLPNVCIGNPTLFTSTGTIGGTHNWAVSPAGGVVITVPTSTNPTITFPGAGVYTVSHTVTAGTCTNVVTTNVTVINVTATFAIPTATQCLTGNSFSFNNTGTAGGVHSYSFSPSIGAPPVGGTASYTGSFTAPGTYTVYHTVVSGGCTVTNTLAVVVNPMPLLSGTPTNASCGLSNGSIVINNLSGAGQGPFVFTNNGAAVATQTITGLGAGTYTVGITNVFGCPFTVTVPITNSPPITALGLTPVNVICGAGFGSITLGAVTGGTPTYSYSVNGGAYTTTPVLTGLTAGTYTIGVKDIYGCTFSQTVTIIVTTGPTAILGSSTPAGCGLSNGSYSLTGVTGGTAAYTYSINGVGTSTLMTGLASGVKTLTVKDANGCLYTQTISILGTVGPTSATITTTNASCGVANGSSTVTGVTGGLATYQYSFDGGAFGFVANTSGLAAGIHTLTVKDANLCTYVMTYNILNTVAPTAAVTASINVSCFGLSNGSFTVTGVGGSGGPFTYSLTTPFTVNGTGFFGGLPAGTYNITLKDILGCSTTASVVLSQPSVLTLTPTTIAAKCFGTNTGTINIAGSGGTGAYMYQLNGGAFQASSSYTAVGAGTYIITIRDANLCTATQTITVTQPPALSVLLTPQNANCTAANGIITSTVTGGTPIYTYTWTGLGGAGATTNSLVAGTYSVTVTDSKGCTLTTFATIGTTPGGLAAITSPSNNVTCFGASNGNLTATSIGGVGPFTYSWTPGGQTTQTASGLAPATYTCVITDFYGCKANAIGTITQPSLLTALMNSNNVKCFGTPTGTVTASGSGGTSPYTYLWTSLSSTLSTVNNVAIGNYSCTITDASGCTITQSIAVTQPSSVTLTSSVTAANCNLANGSTTVTASGGTPAYTYTWSTGSTSSSISGVLAGTYTVIVKDGNNCMQTLSSTIPNLSGPTISILSQTNVSCFGGANGVATALGAGGTGVYVYSWSNGNVTPTAGGLLMGIYTVSVTDVMGCIASTSVNITQPTALTVTLTPTNPKCFGSINGGGLAAAFGGTPVYTYAWTGGGGTAAASSALGAGSYGINVTDAKGCVVTASMTLVNPPAMSASITSTNVSCFGLCNATAVGSSTNAVGVVSYYWTGGSSPISSQTASGLCAGTYTLLATDNNSCTANSIVVITQPTALSAVIGVTGSVTCNGGTNGFTSVTPAGGTPTYSYTWSGAASSAGNSSTANTLPAGVYTVTVSDTKGCTATAVATVLQPAPFATTLTTTNVKCNGVCDGTGNIAFAGGAGTTTFLWQPGLQSGNFVNNLCAGSQTVTITSNAACPTVLTFTLTQPALLTSAVTATNSNCGLSDGKTSATVGGGTAPYSYLWSNGVTTLSNFGILAGAYTFTVTDVNLCKSIGSGLINDVAGPVVSILSSTNVSCFGGSNGAATTTITSALAYSVSWSGNPATTQNVTNFTAGLENITVVNSAGCIGTASVMITQPTALTTAISSFTNVTCFGLTNGGATMLANGGTLGYTYVWTPSGQTSSIMANVGANTYTCLVTDAKGCTSSQAVTITEPTALVMTASSFSNISCFGGSNGSISTTVNGGTPGYTYSWTPTQPNSGVLGGLPAGSYALTVTDTKTCSITANFTILQPSALTSTYTSLPSTCGIANGSATISVGGGTPGYTINWNTAPPQVGTIATSMAPGSWLGVITDSKGCTLTQSVSVLSAASPTITGFTTGQPKCFGMSNGSITVNYAGGTSPYTVSWSAPISVVAPGLTALSHSVTGVTAGAYSATVTDSYGCMHSMPVNVFQPSLLVNTVGTNTTICYGQSAQIYAQGVNGTAPYTYTWTPAIFVGAGPHTVSPLAGTSYSAYVTDANGCTTSPQIITINVTPQLLIAASSYTRCDGDAELLGPSITSPGKGGPYTYNWNTGPTTSSISVIASYPTSPNYYTVTVSDGCSIPASAVFTLNVNPLPVISFSSNVLSGCAPLAITLTGNASGTNNVFQWSVGNNTNTFGNPKSAVFADSGKYTITLVVTNTLTGCKATQTKVDYIEVYPQPIASFIADPQSTSILNPTIHFINTSQGATGYNWNFGDVGAFGSTNTSVLTNPNHTYSYVGSFGVFLVATSSKGCKDTAQLIVDIIADFALYIPNTFTPDGNGVNDFFLPMGVGIDEENYRMEIFDRWGEQVFTSNNFRKGWDGSIKGNKIGEQAVYIYKITVYDLQGNKHPFVGHITLLKAN